MAINAVHGASIQRATCAGFPADWLFNMDNTAARTLYFARVGTLLQATRSSFSHSSLYYHSAYGFAKDILTLHQAVATRHGGGPVPLDARPVLRFYFGHSGAGGSDGSGSLCYELSGSEGSGSGGTCLSNPEDIYNDLVKELIAKSIPEQDWNVRIAVSRSASPLTWNHTKMFIRDGQQAISSSMETNAHEMAIHLTGEPANEALQWYNVLWNDDTRSRSLCVTNDAVLCKETSVWAATLPPVPAEDSLPLPRAANVFSLERGRIMSDLAVAFWDAADAALFAGMDATQGSMFFLNPGMVGYDYGLEDDFSNQFVKKLAASAQAGTDIKFVWGEPEAHPLDNIWPDIDDDVEDSFTALGMTALEKGIAHCRLRVAGYGDGGEPFKHSSHAKFYMLDKGFYIGSQNLYPTGLSGDYSPAVPELKEQGFFVDASTGVNDDVSLAVKTLVAAPTWMRARANTKTTAFATCNSLPHPARVSGTGSSSHGTFTCMSDFDLTLNFKDVTLDEAVKLSGATTCESGPYAVNVNISGVVNTQKQFTGTISGSVPGRFSDTTALTGTFDKATLSLRFSDLEPINGLAYSGVLTTRAPSSGGGSGDGGSGDGGDGGGGDGGSGDGGGGGDGSGGGDGGGGDGSGGGGGDGSGGGGDDGSGGDGSGGGGGNGDGSGGDGSGGGGSGDGGSGDGGGGDGSGGGGGGGDGSGGGGSGDGGGDGSGGDGSGGGGNGGNGGDDTTPGTSWGDPHIVTFDGLAYDFQAVGEFVVLQSTEGAPLQVQLRQRPLGTSRRVAVNTAVAAALGADRVALYTGKSPPLFVNGAAAPLADGAMLDLTGGGRVSLRGNTYTLTWPASTGERVEVGLASNHLDVRLALPPSRKGQVHGIFGNFNNDRSDDVATRDGTILSSPTFQEFYGSFVDSWRVVQAESLFDYATSESTDTFTDRSFPDQFVGLRDLTDDERTAARQVCTDRGITDPTTLDSCTLDVALSGDSTFANSAAAAQPPIESYDMLINLAANRPVTAAGAVSGNPQVVTNTIFAPAGHSWRDVQYVVVTPAGTSLTVDLGAIHSLARLVVQADNNDTYLVESSIDGVVWSTLVTIPMFGGAGMRTRPMITLPSRVDARYARISALSGDNSYSVSEFELYGSAEPTGP
ncbi:VWD domain-containing protein [Myxococcaceae bacterium GXIMD 01537]